MSDLIEKLSNLRSQYNCFDENERDAYHTLSEAIKVLSEQPELCEDAVSRANVLESFADLYDTFEDCSKGIINELHRKFEDLRTLPSVTSKPGHSGDATEMVECDDAVSRTDMLNELDGWIEGFNVNGHKESHADMKLVRRSMSQLPSVTPKRKTGKWIEYDSDEDKYDVIKCPCCKHTFTVDAYHWTDIGFVKDDFKFCPNCGADMNPLPEPYKPKEKNDACD